MDNPFKNIQDEREAIEVARRQRYEAEQREKEETQRRKKMEEELAEALEKKRWVTIKRYSEMVKTVLVQLRNAAYPNLKVRSIDEDLANIKKLSSKLPIESLSWSVGSIETRTHSRGGVGMNSEESWETKEWESKVDVRLLFNDDSDLPKEFECKRKDTKNKVNCGVSESELIVALKNLYPTGSIK